MQAITIEGLGRRYGDRWAVHDLNLQIEQGEVFGLLGPNGAGKTTTMRMIACLIAPTTGRATVCGFDVASQPMHVRERLGLMPEAPGLYENLSVAQNLRFYAKLYDMRPDRASAQIERYLTLLGLWERRNDPAATLSKGMKQKLSIARAIVHDPEVVILDEPTSALDPEGARLVHDFIVSLREQGTTIILCTHNLFEAQRLCGRVAIIKGTLLRVGTPSQLQRSLYGRQVEIRVANALPGNIGEAEAKEGACADRTMNDFAILVAALPGVGDVTVSGNSLLVSMLDPDRITPFVVKSLVSQGADVVRVAEVEQTLERAYLDLVARHDREDLRSRHPEVA